MKLARAFAAFSALASFAAVVTFAAPAAAEPTDPVVIGWWSYFSDQKVDTTTSPQHVVTKFGDPNTYYYEPSGGHGMQEDPNKLPPDQAWQNIVTFILSSNLNTGESMFRFDRSLRKHTRLMRQ